MPICDRCKREADSLMESPLFKGERICDRCRTAEEETYLRVAEDLDKIIRLEKTWKRINKRISERISYLLEGPLKKYEKPYDPEWIEKYRRELYRRNG